MWKIDIKHYLQVDNIDLALIIYIRPLIYRFNPTLIRVEFIWSDMM